MRTQHPCDLSTEKVGSRTINGLTSPMKPHLARGVFTRVRSDQRACLSRQRVVYAADREAGQMWRYPRPRYYPHPLMPLPPSLRALISTQTRSHVPLCRPVDIVQSHLTDDVLTYLTTLDDDESTSFRMASARV